MTFASAWALAGLVLLAPLVLLHLRDRRRTTREVPSLVLWRRLERSATPGRRGLRRPATPLALALQAAALILLVLALAQPHGSAEAKPPARIVVLDDSLSMSAPGRLAAAERLARDAVASAPRGTPVRIVLARATPSVLYRGGAAGAIPALARLHASAAPADLRDALTLAAGLAGRTGDRVTLIRAPEDAPPPVLGPLRVLTVGRRIADQGIFDASARCGIGTADGCEILATVRNGGATAEDDGYTAQVAGRPPLRGRLRVAPGAGAPLVLAAVPGESVKLTLTRPDAIPADDSAWVSVPDPARQRAVVTLVGTPARSLALEQALASVAGVRLRLRTRATYRTADARASALVVLDGPLPPRARVPAPAVLAVDAGGATNPDPAASGSDPSSPLLDGVDLAPLRIDRGAAGRLRLPAWAAPVAWSPGGVLLAAGDDGGRRIAMLAFEPSRSNLPRLPAFPLLIANVVRWATGWAPRSGAAGAPLLIDGTPGALTATLTRDGAVVERVRLHGTATALTPPGPGLYTIAETGPGVRRAQTVAVTPTSPAAGTAATTVVDLRPGAASRVREPGPPLAFAFLIAAAVMLACEWLHAVLRRPRRAAII